MHVKTRSISLSIISEDAQQRGKSYEQKQAKIRQLVWETNPILLTN